MMQRRSPEQEGFTRVEFLVVLVISSLLAAVVVIAAGRLADDGQAAACRAGFSSIAKAEEAYSASQAGGRYTDMTGLVGAGFLEKASSLYTVAFSTVDSRAYTISPIGTTCPAIP